MARRLRQGTMPRQAARRPAAGSGTAAMVASTVLAGILTDDTTAQLAMVALSLGIFAAVVPDTRSTLSAVVISFALFEGLLADQHGFPLLDYTTTSWHLCVLVVAAGLGLGQRWLRHVRDDAALDTEIHDLLRRSGPPAGDAN